MTPAPISVERLEIGLREDGSPKVFVKHNGPYVRHSDYAALLQQLAEREAEVYLLRSWLCDCFVNAGADTDGSTDVRALSERAVQAVIDLRRDYDENEDWKGRACAAQRAREEACKIIAELREYVVNERDAQVLPRKVASYQRELDSIDAFLAASGGEDNARG